MRRIVSISIIIILGYLLIANAGTNIVARFGAVTNLYLVGDKLRLHVTDDSPPPAVDGYWVSTSGSDANAGSSNAPWLTISHAVGQVTNNSTLYIRAGTYSERVFINRAGISNVTIRAFASESVIISNAPSSSSSQHTIWIYSNAMNLTFINLNLAGSYYVVKVEPYWNTSTLTGHGARNMTFSNCTFRDSGHASFKATPASHGVTVVNSTFARNGLIAGLVGGYDQVAGNNTIIRDCVFTNMQEAIEIKGGSTNALVENNYFYGIIGRVIQLGANTTGPFFEAWNTDKWYNVDSTARNNVIINAGGAPFYIQASKGVKFYHNTAYNATTNTYAGLMIDTTTGDGTSVSTNLTFRNNIVVVGLNERNVEMRTNSYQGNLTITHNLWYDILDGAFRATDRRSGTDNYTFSTWTNTFGETSSIQADPDLNTATGVPNGGSDAIDGGVNVGVTTDKNGTARPQNALYDIGAHEQ